MDDDDFAANPPPSDEGSIHSTEVARGSFWGLLGSFFFKFVSFLYVILIARMAAQNDVGLFYLSLAIVTFPIVVSDLGLPASLLRYASFYEARGEGAKVRDLLRYNYWVVTGLGIFFVALLWLLADPLGAMYQNPLLPDAIRVISVFLLLNNIFRVNYSFIQGLADIRRMQLALNIDNSLKLVLTFLFFWFVGPSFFSLAAGFLLAHCLAVLVSLRFVVSKASAFKVSGEGLSFGQFRSEILPFGLMLSAVYSFYLILSSTDRVLLAYIADPAIATSLVAIYSISITLASVLTVLPASIGSVFLPVMSRLAGKEDLAAMRATMRSAQRWVMLISIPPAVFMMLFSGELLGALYGADYAAGALAMSIFTFGVLINSFSYLTASALAAMRKVGLELKIIAAAAIANVVFCAVLIPGFGMVGAALASLISFTLMMALLRHYGMKLFGFTLPAEAPRLLMAGLATFIGVALLKPYAFQAYGLLSVSGPGWLPESGAKLAYLAFLTILAAAIFAVFICISLLLKCFTKEDSALLKKAMARAGVPMPIADFVSALLSHSAERDHLPVRTHANKLKQK